jgi:hypothetical protein
MRAPFAFLAVLGLAVGCGSSFSEAGDGGAPGDTGAVDGSSASEAGDDASTTDVAIEAAGDSSAACPDESGKYDFVDVGAGCGNIAPAGNGCITQTACTITLMFGGAAGLNAVSGTTEIATDGSIADATLMEGSQSRSGCTGAWDAASAKLTLDCGGTDTTQSCRATLSRTAATCN